MLDEDAQADFFREEIAGVLDDFEEELRNQDDYLEKPFRRLTDEILIDIVLLVNQHHTNPGLKDFEIVYDCLHYFLIRSRIGVLDISAAYIQDHWSGCSRDYIPKLNFLRKVGILLPGKNPFKPIPKAKSMKMTECRTFVLEEAWNEKIKAIQVQPVDPSQVRPYGFQRHLESIYRAFDESQKAYLRTLLPRDLASKLKRGIPVEKGSQPVDCGLKIIPHIRNIMLGVKTPPWLRYGGREG